MGMDTRTPHTQIFTIHLQTYFHKQTTMKTKPVFNLRNVCGENILVAEGSENIDFSKIISMNESATFLWNAIKGKEFTTEQLAKLLSDEYEIDDATAYNDAKAIATQWQKAGITEE